MSTLLIEDFQVKLSNLTKVFWPKLNYTKGDLVNYYVEIYPYIKEYLQDRPLSLKIYPDGIKGNSFFQKNVPDHSPHWLSTYPIYSNHRKEPINWVVVNKLSDLVWVANKASIELHGWFSNTKNLTKPDFAVFDLDPGINSTFQDTIETALLIKKILDELRLISFLKTSGKSGLHIYIPIRSFYSFSQIKGFLKNIAEMVIKLNPELATIEWRKNQRRGKVYIDYRQNERGKTLPAPYSLRPTEKATVSTPLSWDELSNDIKPTDFNLSTIKKRVETIGEIWQELLSSKQTLPEFLI